MLHLLNKKVISQSALLLFFLPCMTMINAAKKGNPVLRVDHYDKTHSAYTDQQLLPNPLNGVLFSSLVIRCDKNVLKTINLPQRVKFMAWSKKYYYALKVTLENNNKLVINAYDWPK